MSTNQGNLFLPQSPEAFTHDADGNMTANGQWTFTWDAENRPVGIETTAAAVLAGTPRQQVQWSYLPDGRWSERIVSAWNGSAWVAQSTNRFVWDGVVLLAVLDANNQVEQAYMRGSDLSGSMRGAGGVGGLLAVNARLSGVHFAAFDGNGNLSTLVSASSGVESARYEYSPFGETIRATGPMAAVNSLRFSTQFADDVTGHVKYLYREYITEAGRWPSRDPINEPGFNLLIRSQNPFNWDEEKHLYGFVQNNPVNLVDADGRVAFLAIFFYGNAIGNIGIACYSCKKLNDCLETARDTAQRAADRLDSEEFQDWIRAAKPGSECTGLMKDCGVRVIQASFWVAGRLLILRYLAQ